MKTINEFAQWLLTNSEMIDKLFAEVIITLLLIGTIATIVNIVRNIVRNK